MTKRGLFLFACLAGVIASIATSGMAQKKADAALASAQAQSSDPVLVGAGDIATCGQLEGASNIALAPPWAITSITAMALPATHDISARLRVIQRRLITATISGLGT